MQASEWDIAAQVGQEGSLRDSFPAWVSVSTLSDNACLAEAWLCVERESLKVEDGIPEG